MLLSSMKAPAQTFSIRSSLVTSLGDEPSVFLDQPEYCLSAWGNLDHVFMEYGLSRRTDLDSLVQVRPYY
jgi:hypothetical protein